MKKILLILFLVGLCGQGDAHRPPVLRYWRTDDGLHSPWCFSADYSPLKNLVVCHAHGKLSLLDGYTVQLVDIPIHGETSVKQDEFGDIWLLDSVFSRIEMNPYQRIIGFHHYDARTAEWKYHPIPDEHKVEKVHLSNQLFEFHGRNHVLFTRPSGLLEFDVEKGQITTIFSAAEAGISNLESMIVKSRQKGYWIAYSSGMLRLWVDRKKETPQWQWEKYPFPENYQTLHPFNLHETSNGAIFLTGYTDTIYSYTFLHYQNRSWQPVTDLFQGDIVSGWEDGKGRFWFILNDFSMQVVEGSNVTAIESNDVLGSWVRGFCPADHGSTFIVTSQGVASYSPPLWDRPTFLDSNVYQKTSSLGVDDAGQIWILSDNGLYRVNGEDVEKFSIPYSINSLNFFHQFSDRRLFVGVTRSDLPESANKIALVLFDPLTESFEKIEHPLRRLIHHGFIWTDSQIGAPLLAKTSDNQQTVYLEAFDGNKFVTLGTSDDFPDLKDYLSDVLLMENGDIWFGATQVNGPIVYRNGERITYQTSGYHPFTYMSYLTVGDGKLWAAGTNILAEFNGKSWDEILYHGNESHSALIAQNGDYWAACGNGVWRFHEGAWTFMNHEDGLMGGANQQIVEDNLGRIWINSRRGLYLFNPEADPDPPQTLLDPHQNLSEFAPHQKVQFTYSGIDKWKYTEARRLRYSYRIDDETWRPYTSETVAVLSEASPGKHVFEVRAMDLNYNVDKTPSRWEFTVLLPWYREPKFIGIVALSVLLTFFFAGYAMNRHVHLRHANKNLNQANAQLVQLDQMKSQFVSQASHDLRTPLTAIKGSLDNLLMGIAGELNEKQSKIMERATKSVDRLTNLINDVLDLNRIETGRIVLEKTDIPFKSLVENIIHENRPAADQKQINLSFEADEGDYSLHIDGGKIERVVGELVSNAIKYTPEHGTVDVKLSHDDQQVSLLVKDTGIGMTPEECEKIWDRFYRTSASKKFAKGSGLGLSIAKELVELHGGTITVDSESGKGTTFTLNLHL